jgi:hypothetical protein
MARNVWDEVSTNWMYRPEYGDLFGRAEHNNYRSYQRPRTISLTVRKGFGGETR